MNWARHHFVCGRFQLNGAPALLVNTFVIFIPWVFGMSGIITALFDGARRLID